MAGNVKKRAMVAELERRKREDYEDEAEDMSNLDYVCLVVQAGGTMIGLLDSIRKACRIELSDSALTTYLYKTWPEEAATRLARAREIGAHALVEEAATIIDDASTETREDLKKAELRAGDRRWRAERYNKRELAGLGNGPTINVNLGVLHLDALRRFARQPRPVLPAASEDAVDVPYEVMP